MRCSGNAEELAMYGIVLTLFEALHRNDEAQGLLEYVLIMAVVAFGATSGMSSVATVVNSAFTTMGTIVAQYIS